MLRRRDRQQRCGRVEPVLATRGDDRREPPLEELPAEVPGVEEDVVGARRGHLLDDRPGDNVARREISLCLYIRSNDVGLGTGFNLAEGAALLSLVGRLTGYTPRWFTYFIGDAHIYENHLPMLNEQLSREPLPPPRLEISARIPDHAVTGVYEPEWLERIEPYDFRLVDYRHHGALSAPMAV